MKKLIQIGAVIFLVIGCEDVIDVDTPVEEPRLIVEALILVDTNLVDNVFRIKAGLTTSFFKKTTPAKLEFVCLRPERIGFCNDLYETEEGSGVFETTVPTHVFTEPVDDQRWLLQFRHEGEFYIAFAEYVPTTPMDTLYQGEGTLFNGDETEIVVSFTDNPGQDNFYLFDFDFDEYLVTDDKFYQGQPFQFSYFYENGLKSGQELDIQIIGVDEPFYNYMDQLIVQSGGNQGPFQTPVATVRGNIINVTEIDNIDFFDNVNQTNNFALGYFAICQTFSKSIIID